MVDGRNSMTCLVKHDVQAQAMSFALRFNEILHFAIITQAEIASRGHSARLVGHWG